MSSKWYSFRVEAEVISVRGTTPRAANRKLIEFLAGKPCINQGAEPRLPVAVPDQAPAEQDARSMDEHWDAVSWCMFNMGGGQ